MSDALRQELELLRELGYTHLDVDAGRARTGGNPRVVEEDSSGAPEPVSARAPRVADSSSDPGAELAAFAQSIAARRIHDSSGRLQDY